MKQSKSQSESKLGIILSIGVHATALVLLLAAFSDAPPLPEQHEAVPIETISSTDFEQVMRGQKEVKEIVADIPPPADKVAEPVDTPPDSSKPVAEKDVEAPPPPAPPDPVKDETPPPPPTSEPPPPPVPPPEPVQLPPDPTPPPPPDRPVEAQAPPPPAAVPLPPMPPAPPVPPPPAPLPPQRELPDAETIAPTPPPKPQPPKPVKAAEPKPVPQPPPKPVEAKPPPPRPVPAPKPVEAKLPPPKPRPDKPKPDQLAKLLEQPAAERPAHKAIARPKSAEAQPDQRPFDPTDISKLLSTEAPSQKASTGHQVSKAKAAGSETGVAQKMAASLWDQLDGLLEDQYKQCWSYLGLDGPSKYVPQIKVLYAEDGSLMGEPVLINRPSDPAMLNLAESAVRAVRRCNPLKIPAQYAPYYDQWKGRVLRFDPVDMAG